MTSLRRNALLPAACLIFLALSLPFVSNYLFYQALQKTLKTPINGKFKPYITPRFRIENAQFVWKNKVKLLSGDVDVRYSLLRFLLLREMRLQASGKDLNAELMGAWAQMQGVEAIPLESFQSDLVFKGGKLSEIHSVHAFSKGFQFHIQKSEV